MRRLGFGTKEGMTKAAGEALEVTPQLFRSDEHDAIPHRSRRAKRIVMKLDLCSFLNQYHWIPCWSVNGGIDIRLALADPASVTVLNDSTGAPSLSQNYQLQKDCWIFANEMLLRPYCPFASYCA